MHLFLERVVSLVCSQCQEAFNLPLDLMVHVQSVHAINIFQVGANDLSLSTTVANNVTNPATNEQSTRIKISHDIDPVSYN